MSEENRPGYYKDKYGNWQRDRRKGGDRRKKQNQQAQHERRSVGRRMEDRILERDHHQMIEEALEDFAGQHEEGSESS